MKKIAVVFSHVPYGSNIGQDGVNFLLAASCYTDNINIFFIGDGILHMVNDKHVQCQFITNYFNSFKILTSYNINHFYICYESLVQRGFDKNDTMIVKAEIINMKNLRSKINKCNHIINF